MKRIALKVALAFIINASLLAVAVSPAVAQGQSDKKAAKQELKQVNKEANKLANKADETADQLGRKAVFCILAAHTTGVGTAQELKDKFDTLIDFPFGQFVAAVLLADRIDKPLDEIIAKLVGGDSIGQITKEANANMGDVRGHLGQFKSELARSQTNPPTNDCFKSAP